MANVEHSSGVAALDQKSKRNSKENRSKFAIGKKFELNSTITTLASLVILMALVAITQYLIIMSTQSLMWFALIMIAVEYGFLLSINKIKSRPADYGFIHDLFWAATAPLIAIFAREGFGLSPEELNGSTIYVIASFSVAVVIFPLFSMRHELWEFTALPDLLRICGAVLLNVVVVTFVAFIANRHEGVARTVPLLHFLFLVVPLLGSRICYRYFNLRDADSEGSAEPILTEGNLATPPEHVLLIGVNRLSDFYIKTIEDLGDGSVEVIGLLCEKPVKCGSHIRSVPIMGTTIGLSNWLHDFDVRGVEIDRIVLCCSWEGLCEDSKQVILDCKSERKIRIDQLDDRLENLNEMLKFRRASTTAQCDLHGLTGGVASNIRHVAEQTSTAENDAGLAESQVDISNYFKYKRVLDVIVASCLLIVAFPVMILVGLLVSAMIGFPGIFWQKRPGRQGRVFKVYKFQSMLAPFDGKGNRIPDDARTTRFCRILRRSRMDELPQLLNIITGQMSLVGPRPLLPVDQPKRSQLRLLINPGVTGWAQVNGGIDLTPEEKLALDLWYVRHASAWLDIKIILKSIVMVFRGDRKNEKAVGQAMLELTAYGTGAA